ncbi:MAG: ATP-binding cassette domain-containing protein, partial [Eubacteriales bacterium]|nr:ATP-binding cassette domain-containing protein [Eubacteriales bacterium]
MIKVVNLTKEYGNLKVLNGISETIKENEVVCVIGPSGSGKSTFLRCINLLEMPTSGSVSIQGEKINTKDADINKIRQKLGMVF